MASTSATDGAAVQVPAFELPFSSLASRQAAEAYAAELGRLTTQVDAPPPADAAAMRKQADDEIILPLLAKQEARWPDAVAIEPHEVDGVYTEIFTPAAGVADDRHVLINVHGGGFVVGGRTHGRLESIPIAALGRIRVVSVDYRMAPEHTFPAACEDLATVYRHLLTDYEPGCIGIYGSSAGGMLSAQAVPWLLAQGLPLPGAVGMLGGTGQPLTGGDSAELARLVYGTSAFPPDVGLEVLPYFAGVDVDSELVTPMLFPEVLAQFPPSLLVTGGRAIEMSATIDAHNRLTRAGARSRLHLWDGLGHCFYLDADLPESHEVERVIVDFFAEHLGR